MKSRNTIHVYFITTQRTFQTCMILVFVKLSRLSYVDFVVRSTDNLSLIMTDLSPRETSFVVLVDINVFGNGPPYPLHLRNGNRTKVHDFK